MIDELMHNSFWGIDKIKTPDPVLFNNFKTAYRLPEDYTQLLSVTDGFVLFQAGDYEIYDIDWVLQYKNEPKYSSGLQKDILCIGYFMEYELMINQKESHTGSYLYAGFASSPDDYVRIGTITDFLNGLIHSKGEIPFWEIEGQEKYRFFD